MTRAHRLLRLSPALRGLASAGAIALLAAGAGCLGDVQRKTEDAGPAPGADLGPGAADRGGGGEQGAVPSEGGINCTPGEFVSCTAPDQLQKCDPAGWGLMLVDCYPGHCDPELERCANCDPSQPPQCRDNDVVTCTADGREQAEPCAGTCTDGVCCVDEDGDQHSTCAGDCNDADANVFPGQTEFQVAPSAGSFDYDCDGQEELQYPDTSTPCTEDGTECTGGGWEGAVPGCGEVGDLLQCIARPNQCASKTASATQGCR